MAQVALHQSLSAISLFIGLMFFFFLNWIDFAATDQFFMIVEVDIFNSFNFDIAVYQIEIFKK